MTLLHDVMNAYLSPLLKKHSSGSPLTYEDLTNSMEAAKLVLSEVPNEFVLKRLQSLHNSQVKSYKESAKKSLEQWAQQAPPLPAVQKGETSAAFVTRCYSLLKSARPKWQLDDSELEEWVYKILLRRATETFNNQALQTTGSQTQQSTSTPPRTLQTKQFSMTLSGHKRGLSSASNDTEETADDEDGEVDEQGEEEDGEMGEEEAEDGVEDDGEDGEVGEDEGDEEMNQPEDGNGSSGSTNNATSASATTTKVANGNTNNNNNKRKKQPQQQGRNTKKRVIKKKSTIQKKGPPGGNQNQKANNGATKKVVARKKTQGQGKKGRAAANNKNA